MKKFLITLLLSFIAFISFNINSCIGISQNFKFVIDTIGIPQYNVYGEEINEDIYYTYNVFAYSDPIAMFSKTNTQRFKALPIHGKWTQNGGKYVGYGVQGEYYVLGRSYSGGIIDNVYFPADSLPSTTPDTWNYISFSGAYESWFDKNNYKHEEQLEYMKNTQMLFDADNFRRPPTGKMELAAYGIYANKIGLDKARLNTPSTWKTMGIISTKKRDDRGRIWNSIFSTAPIAANANVVSLLDVADKFLLDENQDMIVIPINFGAEAINLNQYAKEKHIKEIRSTIYIDGKEVGTVSSSKQKKATKAFNLQIDRTKYNICKTYPIQIRVSSYLYTEFSVDGLMQNEINKTIYVQINPKKIVPVNNTDIKILEKSKEELRVKELVKVESGTTSKGIVEAGRNLACKLDLNINASEISKVDTYLNNNSIENSIISKSGNKLVFQFGLEKGLKNTFSSWNYLRDKNKNYFKIDFGDIGKRVKEANELKIVVTVSNIKYEYKLYFDSIDNYDINMNYLFDKNVINKNELSKIQTMKNWIGI